MCRFIAVMLAALVTLSGCSRDEEAALRARLTEWFVLGDVEFFASFARCTAAVYAVRSNLPRHGLKVARSVETAQAQFVEKKQVAFRLEQYTPNDLADALLMSNTGSFGREALSAASQAVPCFKGKPAEGLLREALTRKGALLAYDKESAGMMVLDPEARLLFYVAGDVF
ncbi:MAG: hypothetical protein OIF48_12680 [Silicimonas sp.]|nr:hypothetical protein [Silicimonas sp.]